MQARLRNDPLAHSGVSHVIVLGGINDMGLPVLLGAPAGASAEALIAAHRQIAQQLRADGKKVIGGTITPSGGTFLPGYNSAATQAIRRAVNAWIRTTNVYDAVADFDRVLRDPGNTDLMRAELTADGLHPNTAGYRRMALEAAEALAGL